jgi:hypothetical protein
MKKAGWVARRRPSFVLTLPPFLLRNQIMPLTLSRRVRAATTRSSPHHPNLGVGVHAR